MGARLSVRSAAGPSRCEMPCAWPLRRPRYVDASAAGGEQHGRWIARRWKSRCDDPGFGAGQPPVDGRTNRRERRDPRSYPYAPRGLPDNPGVVVEQDSNNSCSVILATRSASSPLSHSPAHFTPFAERSADKCTGPPRGYTLVTIEPFGGSTEDKYRAKFLIERSRQIE